MSRTLVFTALAAGLFLAGCSSNWRYVRDAPRGQVTTVVVVKSIPPGAEILLDGEYLGASPFEMPVIYAYEARVYQRRETVPLPRVAEKIVKSYHHNVLEFEAHLLDHAVRKHTVTMEGEERLEVTIRLKKLPD